MKKKHAIDVSDESPLKWPDGWPRTLIELRKTRPAWRKGVHEYRTTLVAELERLGATSANITFNTLDSARLDPGVAVWFSMKKTNDFEWQAGLQLNNPAPTIEEIDRAYRTLVGPHHPDRINAGSGGDLMMFKRLGEYRRQARAWVLGEQSQNFEHCIPCDTFGEVRLNLAGIRLALSYFRGLERVGVAAILERVMNSAFRASLPSPEVKHGQVA